MTRAAPTPPSLGRGRRRKGEGAELRAVIQADTRKWSQLAKTVNLKIE